MVTVSDRERDEPRISVTKLGEYLVAPAARRRSIIRNQKRPRDVIVARYNDVYPAIASYLTSRGEGVAGLLNEIDRLYAVPAGTEWQEQNNNLSAEALENFLEFAEELDLGEYDIEVGADDPPKLLVAEVGVSVRPELILSSNGRRRGSGAIKVYISKNNPLGEAAGSYVATALYQYLTDVMRLGVDPDPRHCFVLDVFAQRIHRAPRAYQRKRADIAAACEEIARAWAVM